MFFEIGAHVRLRPADQCSLTWVPEVRIKRAGRFSGGHSLLLTGPASSIRSPGKRNVAPRQRGHMSLLGTMDTMLVLLLVLPLVLVQGDVFTNSFLVRLRDEAPGLEVARAVAERNGFDILGPVSANPIAFYLANKSIDCFIFITIDNTIKGLYRNYTHTHLLHSFP